MAKLLKTILGVAALLIVLSPSIGLAQKASDKIVKLRLADSHIRKVAFMAGIMIDRCDPLAARRGIRDLKKIQDQILLKINSGAQVGKDAKRDHSMLKIRSAWALLEQHLQQHCGTRLVSDKTLRHSYGFFVEDTQKYAQNQLNIALAAAKACDKTAYQRAIGKIKAASDESRRASRKNAQFKDQYAGDAVALEMLAFDLGLRQRVFFKPCAKKKPPPTHSVNVSRLSPPKENEAGQKTPSRHETGRSWSSSGATKPKKNCDHGAIISRINCVTKGMND